MIILGQLVQKHGGKIIPLLIPSNQLKGPSLSNITIANVHNQLLVNFRNLNYVLYHAELNKNEHVWGPLLYLHPEADQTLTTYNYLAQLNNEYNVFAYSLIDTSLLDVEPMWEFIGLEDGRLIHWDNKLYLCGVRRDTTTNGVGRMELSEIGIEGNMAKEISRIRIPGPGNNDSYCEKNWMPILDKPYHFVKWSNPTELVKYDPINQITTTEILTEYKNFGTKDLRGGSQIVRYKNHYIGIIHEVDLYQSEAGRKDGIYTHRILVWDENFNLVNVSDAFSFLDGKIEFCVGLCEYDNKFLATFGFQDNASFLCEISKELMDKLTGL